MIPLALGRDRGARARGAPRRAGRRRRPAGPRRLARRAPGDLFVALNTGVRFVDDALRGAARRRSSRDDQESGARDARAPRARPLRRARSSPWSARRERRRRRTRSRRSAPRVTPTVAAEASRNNELGLPLTVLRLEPDTGCSSPRWGCAGLGQIAELCDDRAARRRARHVHRAGASRARRHRRRRRARERRGDRRASAGRDRRRPGRRAAARAVPPRRPRRPALRPRLGRARTATPWRVPGRRGGEVRLELPVRRSATSPRTSSRRSPPTTRSGSRSTRAQEGAAAISLSRWRGEVHELPGGGLVVNDAYNANPVSMRAALLDLAERARRRRRVAILGEMAELGDGERALPRRDRRAARRARDRGRRRGRRRRRAATSTARRERRHGSRTRRRSTRSRRCCARATRSS